MIVRLVHAALLLAAASGPAAAQELPGFEQVGDTDGVVTYATPDKSVVLMVGRAGDPGAPLEPVMRRLAQSISVCVGLASAPATARGDISVMRSTGAINCQLLAASGAEATFTVLVIAMPTADVDGEAAAVRLLQSRIGSPAGAPPAPVVAAPKGPATGAGGGDVFADVPPAARPVAMIQRQSSGYNGMMATFELTGFALFANGFALDGCLSFDPRQGPPTPALAVRDRSCTVMRWRKSPAGYVLIDEDGEAEEPQPAIAPFRKNERLAIDYRTSSGYSSGAFTPPGGVAVNALFSNELHLAADGTIRTRASSGVSVSGDSIGGGGGRDTGLVPARYALDGHLMAVTDASGTRFHLIGRKMERSGMYIHLDGPLFWADD